MLDYLEESWGLSPILRDQIETFSGLPVLSFPSDFDEDHPEDDTLLDAEEYSLDMQTRGGFRHLPASEQPLLQPGRHSRGKWYLPCGFPQGGNVSPFLSIIQLAMKGSPKFADLLMYADDGLFYSNKKFTEEDVVGWFEDLGLPLSMDKSGWVKSNNNWLKPLKFLGMQFDGVAFRAATRKGATLLYDKAGLVSYLSGSSVKPTQSLLGTYVVYGTLPKFHFESQPFKLLSEARRLREAMGGAYLKIKLMDPSGFCLN